MLLDAMGLYLARLFFCHLLSELYTDLHHIHFCGAQRAEQKTAGLSVVRILVSAIGMPGCRMPRTYRFLRDFSIFFALFGGGGGSLVSFGPDLGPLAVGRPMAQDSLNFGWLALEGGGQTWAQPVHQLFWRRLLPGSLDGFF